MHWWDLLCKFGRKIQAWSKLLVWPGLMVLILLASFRLVVISFAALPKLTQPLDLIFVSLGAVSLALAAITILIGFGAVLGWRSVEKKVQESVATETQNRLKETERELRGRFLAVLGYVIGENSVDEDLTQPLSEERLREALKYCEQAYATLKGTNTSVEFLALNNLLGYSCVLADKSRRGFLLDGARALRAAGEQHDSPNLLLTYTRTMLTFGLEPKEVDDACRILEDVRLNPRLTEKQQREADLLASLCRRRAHR
jgi:hypothetical protein